MIAAVFQDLRIKDVGPLLHDYQQLVPASLALAKGEGDSRGLQLDDLLKVGALTGRYSHFETSNLRIGDLPSLQADYQNLLETQR